MMLGEVAPPDNLAALCKDTFYSYDGCTIDPVLLADMAKKDGSAESLAGIHEIKVADTSAK